MIKEIENRADLRLLVERFYTKIRADEEIGIHQIINSGHCITKLNGVDGVMTLHQKRRNRFIDEIFTLK